MAGGGPAARAAPTAAADHAYRVAVPTRPVTAGILCALLLLAGCGDDDDRDAGPPTATTAPAVTTKSGATAGTDRYHRVGDLRHLGPGQVVGVSADGTAGLVFAEDRTANRLGCEGTPAQFLWAVPLDGDERERAIEGPVQPGNSELVRGPEGRIALVERCEEFLSGIYTATEQEGGRLSDVTAVKIPATDAAPDVTWSRKDGSLIAIVFQFEPNRAGRHLVRLDPVSGRTEQLEVVPDAVRAVELADGKLVIAHVSERGSAITAGPREFNLDAFDLAVAPDGTTVAVAGTAGLYLLGPGEPRKLADGPVYTVTWSADGEAVAFTGTPASGRRRRQDVSVATLDGRVTQVAGDAAFSSAWFTTDGRHLVFSRAEEQEGPDGEPFDIPVASVVDLG